MPRPSAVLIPIFPHPKGERILLLRRPERPGDPYSGQVCLPGGRLEPDDGGALLRCALRETEEEVGVAERHLEVFAELDWHATGLGHRVKPFAARALPDAELRPSAEEVAALLWLPVRRLHPELFGTRRVQAPSGRWHEVLTFEESGHEVWGLTARILASFAAGLWRPPPDDELA